MIGHVRIGRASTRGDAYPGVADLFLTFLTITMSGFGGVLPWARRTLVDKKRWLNDEEFAEALALSQFLPGPNIVNLAIVVGQRYGVAHVWQRFKDAPWRIATQAGLVPVAVGLVAASAYLITRAADHSVMAVALTAVTAGITYGTRINPLWALAAAAAIGFAGYV